MPGSNEVLYTAVSSMFQRIVGNGGARAAVAVGYDLMVGRDSGRLDDLPDDFGVFEGPCVLIQELGPLDPYGSGKPSLATATFGAICTRKLCVAPDIQYRYFFNAGLCNDSADANNHVGLRISLEIRCR